jgi:hypothetical protein
MKTLLLNLFLFGTLTVFGQYRTQYFDGADTIDYYTIFYEIDSLDTNNVWQVGPPQKVLFNASSTSPNALMTDTLYPYPPNDTSTVLFRMPNDWFNWGIFALQWVQKLDFDSTANDGGIVEFSNDNGLSWMNAFNNPYVYNFFGYDPNNAGFIQGTTDGFIGRDTTWRNVWLCLDLSWLSLATDTILFRFTMVSDSTTDDKEGWMIDNVLGNITGVHTVNEIESSQRIQIQPNPASDKLYIQTKKVNEFHIVEQILLHDAQGNVVRHFSNCPTKFWLDVEDLPEGMYHLKVQTNLYTEQIPVVINH